jgi:predicted nucleotidyltransferase
VKRVFLIGSLARGNFGLDSDIDLVVEGLPAEALFHAGADLEGIAKDIGVDLIPLESATLRLRAALDQEGVLLRGSP